jgi:hypothetical protein
LEVAQFGYFIRVVSLTQWRSQSNKSTNLGNRPVRVAFPPGRLTYIAGVNGAGILEEYVMKLFDKKTSANTQRMTVILGVTLCALALWGPGAAAFSLNILQDENQSPPPVTRFVGGWKRAHHDPPIENAFVFMLDGDQLRGTMRTPVWILPGPGSEEDRRRRRLYKDIHTPLPNLKVEGETLTWMFPDWNGQPNYWRASLVSEDDLLLEECGKQPCSPDRPLVSKNILKRQKVGQENKTGDRSQKSKVRKTKDFHSVFCLLSYFPVLHFLVWFFIPQLQNPMQSANLISQMIF